jgi:hypothetical protein
MMPKGGGALGKMKQARAIQKGLKDGSVNPEQLEALGLGGGLGGGGLGGGLGGAPGLPSLPKLPSLPPAGGAPRQGGGRVTAPGTQSASKNKKKKKR